MIAHLSFNTAFALFLTPDEEMTPETAYKAIEEGIKKGQYKVPDPPMCPDIVEGSRQNAINIMKDYIAQSIEGTNRGKDGKFPLLGSSGMKGIGKTTILWYGLRNLLPDGAKGVYLTFNGGGGEFANAFFSSIDAKIAPIEAVGHALLAFAGVKLEIARLLEFDKCLQLFRLVLSSADKSVVLFIDEIGEFQHATNLLSRLMQKMDNRKGKLVYVFAHISQQFLNKCATGSGREVIGLPLETLPIDVWKTDSRFLQWKNASKNPAVHQLLLQCCGHPRSLFDGLAAALQKEEMLLQSSDELAFENARTAIKQKCKFNSFADAELEEAIVKWLSILPRTADFKDQLLRDGLLLKPADDRTTDYFPPLLLQDWAGRRAKDGSSLAFHLKRAYWCDALLRGGAEKQMEGLLYHYEAVLRKAVEGKTFTLKQFYRSKHCGERFENLRVKAPVPEQTDLVERLPNFQDKKRVLGKLKQGFIVVSDLQNEVGIEYLAPFRTAEDNKLIVACAQCKFVEKSPDSSWREIQTKMSTATDWLKKQKIQHFPVIYATADQSYMQRRSYEDGIYFIEDDIFEFTKKLGVLRLHTQKLGEKMQQKHPYLQRASSNADMWYFPLFHCFTNQNRRRTDQMQAGKERTLLRRQSTSMEGYTKSKVWQFDFKGWTKLVWSLFNIIYDLSDYDMYVIYMM